MARLGSLQDLDFGAWSFVVWALFRVQGLGLRGINQKPPLSPHRHEDISAYEEPHLTVSG